MRTTRGLAMLVSWSLPACAHAPELLAPTEHRAVFRSGAGGYHTYRIPALCATHSGVLLAFCEGRKNGRADSGDIDLLLSRSTDGGRTWGPARVIWDDGPNTCGNPCPVVDRDTGVVWLLLTHNLGGDREPEIIERTARGTRTVWVCRSEDDGATWSRPREITMTAKRDDWTWYATGPGIGIQLREGVNRGRLIVPCDHIEAATKHYYSHVIYSDDHGRSWQVGGRSPDHQVNECQVVELVDGRLMLNMRNYDRSERTRQVCFSADGGKSWYSQRHDGALIEPICQAGMIYTSGGLVLFSNPASADRRERMTVRVSRDQGATWDAGRVIHAGPAAYSSLDALPDGSIGCLYERGVAGAYEEIAFCRARVRDVDRESADR